MLRYDRRKQHKPAHKPEADSSSHTSLTMMDVQQQTDRTDPVCMPLPSSTTASICVQTELTMEDIMILEEDNQHRIDELAKLKKDMPKAYPSVYDFKENKKLLRFYTGLDSFTVLMAIFNLISAAIPSRGTCKLSSFEYFTLVLMKLRLHASNYDL